MMIGQRNADPVGRYRQRLTDKLRRGEIPVKSMKLIYFAVFALTLAACAAPNGTEPAVPSMPKANEIVCHAAYRSSVGTGTEREEEIVLGDEDQDQTLSFAELEFHAQYSTGEFNGERALRLWVTEAGQADSLTTQLYQLPVEAGPVNQFIGGHGFTGLNYVYHATGAELQFWCQAK